MSEDAKKRLAAILDAYEAKKEGNRRDAQRRKDVHSGFLEEFAEKVRTTVRPAMQDLAEVLTARGHDCNIDECQESTDSDGRPQPAQVRLTVFPHGQRPPHAGDACPHIAFVVSSATNDVCVHECTMMPGRGGATGSGGNYSLSSITRETVEKHVLKVLSEAMTGWQAG